jgi:hypothetical protein
MTALLDIDIAVVSNADVRRTLRHQIARLEADLPLGMGVRAGDGARIQTIEELERIRDDLVRRIQEGRFEGGEEQDRKRRKREEIGLGVRRGSVSNEEVGEPGCTRWQSWFRLTISGGCP